MTDPAPTLGTYTGLVDLKQELLFHLLQRRSGLGLPTFEEGLLARSAHLSNLPRFLHPQWSGGRIGRLPSPSESPAP